VSAVAAATAPQHPDRHVTAHGWLRAVLRRRSDLSRRARLVASVLFTYMDPDGGSCFPSLATIADGAGYSGTTSVLDGLDELEAGGWLLRDQRRRRDGSPATTSYHAAVPVEAVDPADPVGPPVDPAPATPSTAEIPQSAPVDSVADPVDRPARGTPRPRAGVPRPGGHDLATDLAKTHEPPRARPRRRRRVDRRPPDWQLTRSAGRLYATTNERETG
jgi:hypothetical protein